MLLLCTGTQLPISTLISTAYPTPYGCAISREAYPRPCTPCVALLQPRLTSTLFAYRKSCRNKCLLSLFYRSFRLFCSCSAYRPCEVNNFPFHFPERSKPKTSTFTNKPTRSGRSLNLPRTFLRLTMRPSQCVRPSVSLCPGPSTTFGT